MVQKQNRKQQMKKLLIRTASGAGFAALTVACLLVSKYLFAAYVLFIMAGMMLELFKMSIGDTYRFPQFLSILTGVVLFALVFAYEAFGMNARYIAVSILCLIALMISSLFVKDKAHFDRFSFLFTGLLYIAAPLTMSNLVVFRNGHFSGLILLCFFIIIWCSDVGAYVFGMALGQKHGRKLCPEISTKKSWICFWGGLFFAALSSVLLKWCGLWNLPVIHCIILGLVMGVTGVCGDLFESMWKRHYGLKDSGNVIPGHGGMLDRFDSTLFAMPVGAIYMAIFNLI